MRREYFFFFFFFLFLFFFHVIFPFLNLLSLIETFSRNRTNSTNWNNFDLQSAYVFSIAVSSDALTTIFSDTYLRNHFTFLAYFSASLVAYDLQPYQKSWLVRLVKEKFPQNPKTLAIGYSPHDADVRTDTPPPPLLPPRLTVTYRC